MKMAAGGKKRLPFLFPRAFDECREGQYPADWGQVIDYIQSDSIS